MSLLEMNFWKQSLSTFLVYLRCGLKLGMRTNLQTGWERDSRVEGLDLHFAQGLEEEEEASVEGGGAAIVVRAFWRCDF